MRLKVSFCGTVREFVLEATDKVSDLMLVFQREFDAASEYTNFRVLHKGRDIYHEPGDLSTLVGKGGKVMVMGTQREEVAAVAQKMRPVISAVDIAPCNLSAAAAKKRRQQGPSTSRYIHGISHLPEFPRADEAKALLVQIASDPGVVGVLDKHQWQIGALTELSPFHQPGPDGKILLGLNKNRGQQILLRLRHSRPPDDGSDIFLPYNQIRDTMLHELTHCVHGPHNAAFYELYRQLVKECKACDWRSGGRRVGGAAIYTPHYDDDDAPTFSGSRALGGDVAQFRRLRETGCSPAQMAAASALMRLSTEERVIEAGCGCGGGDAAEDPPPASAQPAPAASAPAVTAPPAPAPRQAALPRQGYSSAPAAVDAPQPTPAEAVPPAALAAADAPSAAVPAEASSELYKCFICNAVMPHGSSVRYLENHVDQCLAKGVPPPATPVEDTPVEPMQVGMLEDGAAPVPAPDGAPLTCPVCCEVFPPRSSERFVSNHVEQCLLRGQ